MKSLIFIITLTFFLNDNLIGIWKSVEENEIKYLNFKDDGKLIEIGQVDITKYNFSQKNNFIQIKKDNGSSKEQTFYIKKDTLVIQSVEQGVVIERKFIKQKLALYMSNKKKGNKGQLAQIVRRKNSTKIKPSGKIYKRSKKIDDE